MPVLGVDGGNTKTVAVVADEQGAVRGAARGGRTDIYSARSPELATAELVRVIEAALDDADLGRADIDAVALSLAGADWPEDFAYHRATARALFGDVPSVVVNDAIGPIRSAVRSGVGVTLICGTAAAIGGRGPGGLVWHVGFTPRAGGASGLGREALSAVQEADMACGPATALTERLLAAFGVSTPREIVHAVTHRGTHADPATLGPAVLAVAEEGDPVAREIVRRVGIWMGQWTAYTARHVGLEARFPLVIGGGLVRFPGAARLIDQALAEVPNADPLPLVGQPVMGAVLTALDLVGASVDEHALRGDLHPSVLG